jgi:DNA-binding transcriptional ArsR family regulator
MTDTGEAEQHAAADLSDAEQQARVRALASPVRMRILRLCLHEARTNKELAAELDINAGTMLHHVRSLVAQGFLRAEEPRRGARGAKEVPYRATGLSWRSGPMPNQGQILLDTFLDEIQGLDPDTLSTTRLGLKLNADERETMLDRVQAIFQEYVDRGPDPDGEPISIFFVEHPDLPRSQRAAARPKDHG